jgi:hypothetical protein
VHAPDPVVEHSDPRTAEVGRCAAQHLGAETVVAEEDIADAGYQNSRRNDTLHVTNAQIAPHIGDGSQTDGDSGNRDRGHDADGHPTYYCHLELLSGLSSSSAERFDLIR